MRITKPTAIFTFIFALIFAQISSAQFNIKIPKIKKKSKVEQPKKKNVSVSNTNGRLIDSRPESREMVMDDAFTYFEANPITKRDASKARDVDDGWVLKSYLRVMGTFPRRSAFKISVLKNGKVLGTSRCGGGRYVYNAKAVPRMLYLGDNFLWHDTGCWSNKGKIKQVGKFDVEIRVVNGDNDEETLVRTYKIDVQKITRVRGSAVNSYPDSSEYAVMRHKDSAVAFIHLTSPGMKDYYNKTKTSTSSSGRSQVELYFSMSPEKGGKHLRRGYIKCSVDGTQIQFPDNGSSTDLMTTQALRTIALQYTDRISPKFKRGAEYKDRLIFTQLRSILPMAWGGDGKKYSKFEISTKPGNWECKFMNNGETYRIFRFKVTIDGLIGPHPEQASGNVNLYHNAFMIDMEIPGGGTEFDYRLGPQLAKGFFYGIPWKTAEGKAMAARVPKKGSLLPTPSNKVR